MDNRIYLGIDLDDLNAVVSCYELNKKEPETVSTVAGSEVFQIPVILAKKKGLGQWFIGGEARRLTALAGGEGVSGLLSRAVNGEIAFLDGEKYTACELLTLYIKKLILLAGSLGKQTDFDRLVICVEKLSREVTDVFAKVAEGLGLAERQLKLIDRKECFYYFVYHQNPELFLHDVFLFDYNREDVTCLRLNRNLRTKPQLVTISEEVHRMGQTGRDEAFLRIVQESFKGHIISSVYLVGDGFGGDWMKQSIAFLCKGRRAFIGKNLYSKGACYAAARSDENGGWPYVYLGDNEMKVNVSLKVRRCGAEEFYTLINAGDNWYETVGACEVLLDGSPQIDFWLQLPNSREAKVEKLELSDLPERPVRASRLRITAKPLSDREIQILIKDLGFGEIFKSSDKTWEYVMSV